MTSPDEIHRYKIDYILVRRRWKSAVKSAKAYPGADCGTDHNLVVADIKIHLKRPNRSENILKYDTNKLDKTTV